MIAVGTSLASIEFWDLGSGKQTVNCHEPIRGAHSITATAFSPDGKTLASVGPAGKMVPAVGQINRIYLWEVSTGKLLKEMETNGQDIKGLLSVRMARR